VTMTFAIYRDTPDGQLRIGTWTHKGRGSVRELSEAFYKKYPHAEGQHYIASRWLIMGVWTDGELLPMEVQP
jgi:hypothetical protein